MIEVLDPTAETIPDSAVVSPRPESLDQVTLGLLANGKHNAPELLDMVHEVLADTYEFADVVSRNKGNASRPCPPHILQEMADLCDVVITASGD
jgi:hypothetical protein